MPQKMKVQCTFGDELQNVSARMMNRTLLNESKMFHGALSAERDLCIPWCALSVPWCALMRITDVKNVPKVPKQLHP